MFGPLSPLMSVSHYMISQRQWSIRPQTCKLHNR